MSRTEQMLLNMGFEKIDTEQVTNIPAITYRKPIGYGFMQVVLTNNEKAVRLDKPNKTHKWLYEKSTAQLYAILRQTEAFYKVGR